MSNFTVISDEEAVLFNKLKEFYKEVCYLTINHEVDNEGNAVISPNKLSPVLEKVNPFWFTENL